MWMMMDVHLVWVGGLTSRRMLWCVIIHVSSQNSPSSFLFLPALNSTLEGHYVDDALHGQGVYTYEDGAVLYGTYVDGELNGPAQEFDGAGRLMFKGQYRDNSRCGECSVYYPVSHTRVLCQTDGIFMFSK